MPSVYEPLVAELRRRRHVFWHAPASVRTPEFSKELIELLGGVYPGVNLIDCTNLPRDPARGIVDVDRLNNSADVNVLVDFDHLIDHVYGRTWMRQLRPPLMSALENDKCLLVLSRRPQSAFPQVEGSNLATDAPGFYLARINDPDDLSAISTPADDLSKEYADWLLSVSGGIVGLLARLLPACHRLGKTARKKVAKGIVQEIVGETVRDCGPLSLAWLIDNYVYGQSDQFSGDEVPGQIFNALRAASFLQVDSFEDRCSLFPDMPHPWVKDALIQADEGIVEPPSVWVDVSKELFRFERAVRSVLQRHLEDDPALFEAKQKHWASHSWKNFQQDTGWTKREMEDLPSPLAWLDLSALLAECVDVSEKRSVAGVSQRDWKRIGDDVVRIRNRTMHMRVPGPGDLETVRNWRKRIEMKLSIANRSEASS